MEKRSVMEGRRRPEKRIFAGNKPSNKHWRREIEREGHPCPPRRHDLKRKEDSEGLFSFTRDPTKCYRKSPLTLGVKEDDHCCGF
ncbi:hypothetical protein LOK49_LG06G02522 [Camellia lanceoleosa]|uniref:Uncharacterized protein n=1 Tax=Camellia lanceoleosa TaxID=1840588 RepID=A0ACC0HI20_9ERIC|nr:hypothetical protein LOK49_LG06G02522 [Camellia lanceoleosa]